jgi:hypothetical protein
MRDRPLASACLAGVAAVTVALAFVTPRYETNDDACMQLLASGRVVADRPDEHLMYSNVLVGLPLKALYDAAPAVPWYGAYQLLTLTVAAVAACYALLRINASPGGAAAVALILAVAVVPAMAEVQFTKTAFLATIAGFLLLLAPLRADLPRPRVADAAGVALAVWGSLVRVESFVLAVLVAAPVAAIATYAAPARAARRAVPLGLALALAVAAYWFNLRYYARDPGWADYYAYGALRVQFTDYDRYPYAPEIEDALREVGWERVDLDMLNEWFFIDPERYSLETLRRAVAVLPAARGRPSLVGALKEVGKLFDAWPMIVLVLAAPCGAVLAGGGRRQLAVTAVLLAGAFGLTVLMRMYYAFPFRAAFSLYAGVAGGTVFLAGPPAALGPRKCAVAHLQRFAAAGAAGLVVCTFVGLDRWDKERELLRRETGRLLRELDPRPDQLFVTWEAYMPYEYFVQPLDNDVALMPLRCVWLSALQRTPVTRARCREFGISDLYQAICERKDVYLVAQPYFIEMFRYYIRAHYAEYAEEAPRFWLKLTPPPEVRCYVFQSGSAKDQPPVRRER